MLILGSPDFAKTSGGKLYPNSFILYNFWHKIYKLLAKTRKSVTFNGLIVLYILGFLLKSTLLHQTQHYDKRITDNLHFPREGLKRKSMH